MTPAREVWLVLDANGIPSGPADSGSEVSAEIAARGLAEDVPQWGPYRVVKYVPEAWLAQAKEALAAMCHGVERDEQTQMWRGDLVPVGGIMQALIGAMETEGGLAVVRYCGHLERLLRESRAVVAAARAQASAWQAWQDEQARSTEIESAPSTAAFCRWENACRATEQAVQQGARRGS